MITKFRTMALAASSVLMMGATAQAADLYTPAPAPMPDYTGGWYFSGFGGANWLDDTSFDIGSPDVPAPVANAYDTGYVVGGAIGYDMGPAMGPFGLRLEAELSYRDNEVKSHTVVNTGASLAGPFGSTSALAGMGNVLFDFNTGSPFTFYGGGGLGVAKIEFDNHGASSILINNGRVLDDSDTVFAWQAIAGMGYEIAPNMVLDVQYRYFNASDVSLTPIGSPYSSSTDYESHAVVGGIRFKF